MQAATKGEEYRNPSVTTTVAKEKEKHLFPNTTAVQHGRQQYKDSAVNKSPIFTCCACPLFVFVVGEGLRESRGC